MARRAVIPVSMEMIHQLLRLPDGMEVLHVAPGNAGLTLDVVVTAPDMADLDPAAQPPALSPTYVRDERGVRLDSIDYPREQRAERGV